MLAENKAVLEDAFNYVQPVNARINLFSKALNIEILENTYALVTFGSGGFKVINISGYDLDSPGSLAGENVYMSDDLLSMIDVVGFFVYFPLTRSMNSDRVLLFSLNVPRIALVVIVALAFWMPRITMHI